MTILVGENGTGKSTLVEAVAMAYGLNAEGGSTALELDEDGYHEATWDELELVGHHRRFLQRPGSYLRHLGPVGPGD